MTPDEKLVSAAAVRVACGNSAISLRRSRSKIGALVVQLAGVPLALCLSPSRARAREREEKTTGIRASTNPCRAKSRDSQMRPAKPVKPKRETVLSLARSLARSLTIDLART